MPENCNAVRETTGDRGVGGRARCRSGPLPSQQNDARNADGVGELDFFQAQPSGGETSRHYAASAEWRRSPGVRARMCSSRADWRPTTGCATPPTVWRLQPRVLFLDLPSRRSSLTPRCTYFFWFLTQMYARFSPRRVRHRSGKTPRMCPCPVRSGAVVCRSVDGRLRGPALGGGPARRQPDQTQAADSMALTWRRTVKASGTRPRLSPTFYARAEPSLTVQPPWSWQPRHDSAVCCGRTFREPATALQIRAVFFSHVSH